jgi:hypothetical protein
VTRDEQLQWESRWGVPAAIASFGAAVLLVISATVFLPEDRKGIGRAPDLLLSIDEQSGSYLASAVLTALAALLLLAVFYYLFRAVEARGGGVPHWFVYLVIGAPVLFAIGAVAYAIQAVDIADDFVSGSPIRGEAGEDRAKELSDVNPLLLAAQTAGTVGVAFLFVMLPLRARRVGLLTPFMGIIGAISGALIVFQLAGVSAIVQGFFLGALGMLLLGRWPGGRGPAWESGEAEPWPTPAQRRAELAAETPADGAEPTPGDAPEPTAGTATESTAPSPPEADPEPVPERPPSRKRKKKR